MTPLLRAAAAGEAASVRALLESGAARDATATARARALNPQKTNPSF